MVLKLEGRIAGPSLQEMERDWNAVAANLSSRKLMLDIRAETIIESDAEELYKKNYQQTAEEFQTS